MKPVLTTALGAVAIACFLSRPSLATAQQRPDSTRHAAARGSQKHEREDDEQGEHERTVAAAQVPAAVRSAVTRAYPAAHVSKWTSEVERGTTYYEAETVDGATHRDLLLKADGTITEVETQVTPAQLPAAVRTAATAGNARITKAEMVVEGRDTTYEMTIRGRHGELKLRPNGTPAPARD